MPKLVTISPKGQITIPTSYRKRIKVKQYLFDTKGAVITLRPVEMKELQSDTEELAGAALSSFKFWDDASNDAYDQLL